MLEGGRVELSIEWYLDASTSAVAAAGFDAMRCDAINAIRQVQA